MFFSLMSTRRFAPLFWCQFFSAFNDNFVRQMLALLILFRIGEGSGALVTLAVAIFILPSFLLSGIGGEIADAGDKSIVARRLKFAEIFVQMIAAAGFYFSSLGLLYGALFGLGVIAALFGPIKYGILPDHLETKELTAGNALVEGATFLAILLGLVVGGYAADHGREPITVVAQLMVVALLCWGASRFIPATGIAAPGLKIDPNIFASTGRLLRDLKAERRLWIGGIAVSWFWMTGAIALSLVPIVVKTRIGGGIDVETAISALFAVGIGTGSVVAAIISHGQIRLLPVPLSGLAMGLFLLDLGLATGGLPQASGQVSLTDFMASAKGLRIAFDVLGVAGFGGLFVVPIFTAVQSWAGEDRRARTVAGVNVLNSIYIVGGTIAVAALQAIGLSEPILLALLGALNLGFAIWLFRNLPGSLVGEALNALFRTIFRLEVEGLENVAKAGPRCVIAVNHVSFLDAPVVLSILDDKPVFAIDWQIAKAWWVRPFLGIARCFPMDPTKPLSTRGLIKEVRDGHRLVIFPEGRLTVTGGLMKVYDGAAMIADKAEAMIVPVRLEGLEKTYFTRLAKEQTTRSLFPKVRVTFLPPRKLAIDPLLVGRKRRIAAGAALHDVMEELLFRTTGYDLTLSDAVAQSMKRVGLSRIAVEDPLGGRLTNRKVLLGSAIFARKFMGITREGENVGLMLPNTNAAAVAFCGLQQCGRVVAMLNYTAGAANLRSACLAARITQVITSRAFIEKANLGAVADAMSQDVTLHYLEDMRKTISTSDKLRGLIDSGRSLHSRRPEQPAVVLFTSGSEGLPKGVVLSHQNIMANIAQILARYDITGRDILFNALPVFHSFGLTAGMLLGLFTGARIYLYPSPLHYRQIPELIYGTNATVLFGTDTFLTGYARMANAYDFRSLRYIIAGAERVKEDTRRLYMEKFGQRILEGYGVTETAPVLAVNSPMFNRNGTVGRLMMGVEHRIEPVPGIAEGGRLLVRGPNIMLGYYRADNPGVLEETPLGWHDTGDIVMLDEQNYVVIKGRAKRFAKIAGEMVSLAQVEQICGDLWPEHSPAVVAVPDARKGERLVMVTTKVGATRSEVHAWMKTHHATELMVPAEVITVDALPLLGSGKTDYVELNRLVLSRVGQSAA